MIHYLLNHASISFSKTACEAKLPTATLFRSALAVLFWVLFGGAAQAQNYTITTTGGALVITDNSNNGEVIAMSQSGTNIQFVVTPTTRTYKINGGAITAFTTPANIALSSTTSITINAAGGDDDISVAAFTSSLPSLTINGGTGAEYVYLNGDINFISNANLDLDLQNDDANPGSDDLYVASNANIKLTGTGAATIKMSALVQINTEASIETVNGNLLVEANQQATPNTGPFSGVTVTGVGSKLSCSGTGTLTVKGTGGDSGTCYGVTLASGGKIIGGTGPVSVVGKGGIPSGTSNNIGVSLTGANSAITSTGGDVSVTGNEGTGTGSIGISMATSASITTATNGGNITLTANSMGIAGNGISANASSSVTLRTPDNIQITLGTTTNTIGGPLGLSDAELDLVTGGSIIIGHANAGSITVYGNITHLTSNMSLVTGGDITISGGSISSGTGTLLLDCGASPAAIKPTFSGTDVTASTLSFGSDLAIAINGSTVNTDYTQLNAAGVINLTGVDLVLSGSHIPLLGQTFTIVANDGTDPIIGTFTGLAQGATINNFMQPGTVATISYTGGDGNDIVLTVTVGPAQNYTITTTGGAIVITDNTNLDEPIVISQSGAGVQFIVTPTSRTYSINGGANMTFATPANIPLSGATSITVNAAGGNDNITIEAFTTSLPSLTINGGTGDDVITFNGDINFLANANLDLDLQNDDPNPGTDRLILGIAANIKLSGTGTATVKVSRSVYLSGDSSIEMVNGNLQVEANQQSIPTTGNFFGVDIVSYGKLECTGTGTVTVMGRSGDAINLDGIQLDGNAKIIGGLGDLTVIGVGFQIGVDIHSAIITSYGGNVNITGSCFGLNSFAGVHLLSGQISAGGSGAVTVLGQGFLGAAGILLDNGSTITSLGGNVSITGDEGTTTTGLGIVINTNSSVTTATNGGGNITLQAKSMNITSGTSVSANASSTVTLRTPDNTQIDLGQTTNTLGGPLSLSDAELDLVTGGTIIIGHGSAGNIAVSAAITHTTSHVSLITGGDILISSASISSGTGAMLLDCGTSPAAIKPTFSGTDVTAATLSFGSDLAFVINGTTVNTQYTQLNVAGAINLTGVDLVLSGTHVPVVGQTFIIVDNDGTDAITGTFVGLSQGATISSFLGSVYNATISYTGGTGNDVVLTVTIALPVELVSFTGKEVEEKVLLDWRTASELNNRGFYVERSTDTGSGLRWEDIGFVQGNSNSTDTHNYSFLDEKPLTGVNYYRLRQVDTDERFTYSHVISVHFKTKGVKAGAFYPNPSKSGMVQLDYLAEQDEDISIAVFDVSGKLVLQHIKAVSSGENQLSFNFSQLQVGVYIVEIGNESNQMHRKLLIER